MSRRIFGFLLMNMEKYRATNRGGQWRKTRFPEGGLWIKFFAELVRIHGRHWGAGLPYGTNFGSPEGGFPFPPPYADGYCFHMAAAEKGPLYGVGTASRKAHEKPRSNRR